ncbi:MAG: hypothetical protein IID48_18460, partial [Proteobacteria bacterium]|nr:hypothetical protein [Pseudomonadota bacterium]
KMTALTALGKHLGLFGNGRKAALLRAAAQNGGTDNGGTDNGADTARWNRVTQDAPMTPGNASLAESLASLPASERP